MKINPVLLMGGSGAIGQHTARAIRAAHPTIPLLIGGRDLAKAEQSARQIGGAQGVKIDPASENLGLGEQQVSAVLVFYMDHALAGLRFAQKRRVPYLSISSGVFEIAPEIATYMHTPDASPVVLGYEWMSGATTVSVLRIAKAFRRVNDISINALVDEEDTGGPAVAADFEHLSKMQPAALTRRDGRFMWREGDEAKVSFRAIDGTEIEAAGFSSIDVAGLAAATGASNVEFNLATAISSTRRQGGPKSTEIIIELTGEDVTGKALSTRHAVFHPAGAALLTSLSVTMLTERLLGLDGLPPTAPGLYFPYQLLDEAAFFARLKQEGGALRSL